MTWWKLRRLVTRIWLWVAREKETLLTKVQIWQPFSFVCPLYRLPDFLRRGIISFPCSNDSKNFSMQTDQINLTGSSCLVHFPQYRDDHAVVMVRYGHTPHSFDCVCRLLEFDPHQWNWLFLFRFAFDCLTKMKELAQELTLELGPGTEELTMRFGLHSGPVTAVSLQHIATYNTLASTFTHCSSWWYIKSRVS